MTTDEYLKVSIMKLHHIVRSEVGELKTKLIMGLVSVPLTFYTLSFSLVWFSQFWEAITEGHGRLIIRVFRKVCSGQFCIWCWRSTSIFFFLTHSLFYFISISSILSLTVPHLFVSPSPQPPEIQGKGKPLLFTLQDLVLRWLFLKGICLVSDQLSFPFSTDRGLLHVPWAKQHKCRYQVLKRRQLRTSTKV